MLTVAPGVGKWKSMEEIYLQESIARTSVLFNHILFISSWSGGPAKIFMRTSAHIGTHLTGSLLLTVEWPWLRQPGLMMTSRTACVRQSRPLGGDWNMPGGGGGFEPSSSRKLRTQDPHASHSATAIYYSIFSFNKCVQSRWRVMLSIIIRVSGFPCTHRQG